MPLQDLPPQLRPRLSRVEHAVGVFVIIATVLLLSGFGYYFYYRAQARGWFDLKAPFYTYLDSAAGLKEGGKVKMMGREAGEITAIKAMPPDSAEYFERHFVYVEFIVRSKDIGYIWTDSRVRVNADDLLGGRHLELLPGGWNGYTNHDGSKKTLHAVYEVKGKLITGIWQDQSGGYTNWSTGNKPYHIVADEFGRFIGIFGHRIGSVVCEHLLHCCCSRRLHDNVVQSRHDGFRRSLWRASGLLTAGSLGVADLLRPPCFNSRIETSSDHSPHDSLKYARRDSGRLRSHCQS